MYLLWWPKTGYQCNSDFDLCQLLLCHCFLVDPVVDQVYDSNTGCFLAVLEPLWMGCALGLLRCRCCRLRCCRRDHCRMRMLTFAKQQVVKPFWSGFGSWFVCWRAFAWILGGGGVCGWTRKWNPFITPSNWESDPESNPEWFWHFYRTSKGFCLGKRFWSQYWNSISWEYSYMVCSLDWSQNPSRTMI